MIIENAQIVSTIPCRHKNSPAFFHSFGLTEDYVVFIEQPLFVDDDWNGYQGNNTHKNLRWKKNEMVSI
jgi:carotenoid cleavage dioxygenase-like enzyme